MTIAAAVCGALTLTLWLRPDAPRGQQTLVILPALAWLVALCLSAIFAFDRAASLARLGKGLLPALVPLAAFHAANRWDGQRALGLLLLSSALASLYGIVFFVAAGASFASRARGPTGHYMTFGGQLLLIVSLAVAVALLARQRSWRVGGMLTAAIGAVALAGTFTRSAWLGLAASLALTLAWVRPRWVPLLALAFAAAYWLAPGDYRTRLQSAFDPSHPMNQERVHMWQAGARMFLERPLTGVGLQDLRPIYERYRSPEAREPAGHLHNVFVQIAATMGIVGLAAFVLLYGSLLACAGLGLKDMLRAPDLASGVRLGVLAALVGFLVAGLFEWNFGDEELLYLLYVLVGMAWAARRWGQVEHPEKQA